jgi:hypothetical protein
MLAAKSGRTARIRDIGFVFKMGAGDMSATISLA